MLFCSQCTLFRSPSEFYRWGAVRWAVCRRCCLSVFEATSFPAPGVSVESALSSRAPALLHAAREPLRAATRAATAKRNEEGSPGTRARVLTELAARREAVQAAMRDPEWRKQCTRCGELRLAGEYFPHPQTQTGLNTQCVYCCRERGQDYRASEHGRKKKAEHRATCDRTTEYARKREKNAAARPHQAHVRAYSKHLTALAAAAKHAAKRAAYVPKPVKPKTGLPFALPDMSGKSKNHRKKAIRKTRLWLATPPWADSLAIWEIYERARRTTAEFGLPFEVDHIVPLSSPIVCGLHVPANLQVRMGAVNARKSNLTWPDMP